jgi:hypothetical protein
MSPPAPIFTLLNNVLYSAIAQGRREGRGVTLEIIWRTSLGIIWRSGMSRRRLRKVRSVVSVISRTFVRHSPTKTVRRIASDFALEQGDHEAVE